MQLVWCRSKSVYHSYLFRNPIIILLFSFKAHVYISIDSELHMHLLLFCTLLVFPQPFAQFTVLCIPAFFQIFVFMHFFSILHLFRDPYYSVPVFHVYCSSATISSRGSLKLYYLIFSVGPHIYAGLLYCCMATRERCTPQVLET